MSERYSSIGFFFCVTIILLDFYLLRKRKISGKGFAFWLILGTIFGAFSLVPYLFNLILIIFGTQYLISAVTATGFFFFILATFYLYYRISELHSQLMKLAMEVSVTKYTQKESRSSSKQSVSDKKQEKRE